MLVLIVEDDLALAETLRQAFAAENHESLAASNALGGLDLLRAHPIDLFMVKPIRAEDLFEKVRALIARSSR